MRVVLDTNVLYAASATRGLCEAVVEACLASHDIIISEHILSELGRHLLGKLRLPDDHVQEIVSFLRDHAQVVDPSSMDIAACRDRSDLPILGTAIAARADCIVTGDNDLLILVEFEGIPILSPRAFHDRLK